MLLNFLVVGAGGAAGAFFRGLLTTIIGEHLLTRFPAATFCINFIACFTMGCLLQATMGDLLYQMLTAGFLGGFSTLSSVNHESVVLFKHQHHWGSLGYLLLSYLSCLIATLLGYAAFLAATSL